MTAPTPTPTAVDALAAHLWAQAAETAGAHPWHSIPAEVRERVTATARDLLTAVYPQIVADVLDHYEERLRSDGIGWAEDDEYAGWLNARADEVRP
jgi:hypothetical protein